MRTRSLDSGTVALDAPWPAMPATERVAARERSFHRVLIVVTAALMIAIVALLWLRRATIESLPRAPAPAGALFAAPVPVMVTVSGGGRRAPWATTEEELRGGVEMWKRMHLEDWDQVAAPLRRDGLDNLLKRYAGLINTPAVWDRMTVYDWDDVPQPVRIVAYRRMIAYWAGFYHLGARYDLPPTVVADTLAAIVMSESWFEHRARSANRDGGFDIGLGQASPYARARLRELHDAGRVDVALSDEDYDNPWMATRFVALWMEQMLDESGGDLDRAIRAYNRGAADAMDGGGAAYLAAVQRRLTRFIRDVDAPKAWDHVWRRSRHVLAEHPAAKTQ